MPLQNTSGVLPCTVGIDTPYLPMKCRRLVVLSFLICVLFFATYFLNRETSPPLSDFPLQVFVDDTSYGSTGHYHSVLPDDADYMGSIINVVPQHEPMVHENFYSNGLSIGTEIYFSKLNPNLIYAKVENSSGKVLYEEYEMDSCE